MTEPGQAADEMSSSHVANRLSVSPQPDRHAAGAATEPTEPMPVVSHGGNRGTKSRLRTLAAVAAAIVLLGVIITIATKKGTVVVEGPDGGALPKGVTVTLTSGGEEIEITSISQWTVRAVPDEFQVTVRDSQDRFQYKGQTLTVQRFGRTVLKISRKPAVVAPSENSQPDYALQFDGKSSYVLIDSLPLSKEGPNTFEAFATSSNRNTSQSVVDAANADARVALFINSHHWTGSVWRNSDLKYLARGTPNNSIGKRPQTYHVAVVWERRSRIGRLFVDGVEHLNTGIANFQHPLERPGTVIGAFIDLDSAFFAGTIDEVRISNVARYTKDFDPPQPGERFAPDEHTLALYHFDEGEGEIAHDSSGNKHDGKIVGAKWVKLNDAEQVRSPCGEVISPADGWVDLLSLIDAKLDLLLSTDYSGTVESTDGRLILHKSGRKGPRIGIPVSLEGSYEVEVEFTREAGGQDFRLHLPLAGRFANFAVGRHDFAGLSFLKSQSRFVEGNFPIESGKRYRMHVTLNHQGDTSATRVKMNDKLVDSWTGSTRELDDRFDSAQMSMSVMNSRYVIHAVRLRILDGEAKLLRAPGIPFSSERQVAE